MNNPSQAIIIPSETFSGAFVVIHPDGRQVPCANLSTAKIEAGLLDLGQAPTFEELSWSPDLDTAIEAIYGVKLGGLGRHTPAVTWTLTGRVERVHNWSTAQAIVRDNEKAYGTPSLD